MPPDAGRADRVARDVARAIEPDRYLAALLAPGSSRADLIALAAFSADVGRIPEAVREPMLGEIRLQWWRDELSKPSGASSGAPVADAMRAAMARRGWTAADLEPVLEATAARLYADPIADERQLRAEAAAREGPLFRLALDATGDHVPAGDPVVVAAGAAFGVTRMLCQLPFQLAKGRVPIPVTWLDGIEPDPRDFAAPEAKALRDRALARMRQLVRDELAAAQHLIAARPRFSAAWLPLALVEPYLRVLEQNAHDPMRHIADLSPLARSWQLWRASRRGHV